MKTVTAKELRENLSDIINQVESGEEVVVIRRSRPAIRLVAERSVESNIPAIVAATGRYLSSMKQSGITIKSDPNRSIKELYHEAMDNDPKYARYVTKPKK